MATSTAKNKDQEPAQGDAPDSPLLDLSDQSVKKMIKAAKARGFVTYDELNEVLPSPRCLRKRSRTPWPCLPTWGST